MKDINHTFIQQGKDYNAGTLYRMIESLSEPGGLGA